MVKEKLQKELKDKVKEGVKPSDIRRLKRSQSEGDLPTPQTQILNRSQSSNNIPTAPTSPTLKIKQLEDKISVLELTVETKDRELLEKDSEIKQLKKNPPNLLLADQLKQKQKDLESLREQLATVSTELTTLKNSQESILDENLTLKHQSLKDWWQQYEKNQDLERELVENIDYASNELIEQDKVINSLQKQTNQLKLTNQSLQKDLNLAHKLIELRKDYPFSSEPDYWKYALYSLVAICFISLLNTSWKVYQNE